MAAGGRGVRRTSVRVRFWGVRGSVPVATGAMRRHGGNTPCIEIRTLDDRLVILDAGTGIRDLGKALVAEGVPTDVDLFLTHYHLDHIQGLPFFAPLRHPSTALRIHAPSQGGSGPEVILGKRLAPIFFPVPVDAYRAALSFMTVPDGAVAIGESRITSCQVNHPSHTRGYRIHSGGIAVAYLPDNELTGADDPDAANTHRAETIEIARGADLLIHDAMYTEAEYGRRKGWGHSTYEQAIRLAEVAEVRALCFFHHDPDRTDLELERIVAARRRELEERGSRLRLFAAREGDAIELPGR
jgi:phosphoribosyl 1,2-cyclic phosphodiesterase